MPPINPGGFMGPPPGMQGPPPDGMMPPPNNNIPRIDPSKEIWVETMSADGKIYFYHSKTRQSIWKRPTGDNVQIIQQNEAGFSLLLFCLFEKFCHSCVIKQIF